MLTATTTPSDATNQNVTWASSNTDIATVDSRGKVTAISVGTTTIIVAAVDGGKTAISNITVSVPATGITLDRGRLELAIDDTAILTAIVAPDNATNQEVRWTSRNNNIATVDNYGKVTARAPGTTTITVTTADGGKRADAEITVIRVGIGAPTATTDPGLVIAGRRWATRNVDAPGTFAQNPQDAGMFYQWNRRVGWASTGYEFPNPMPGWNNTLPTGTEWYAENDPCPRGWRVPMSPELEALVAAGSTWVTNWNNTGVSGRLYGTSPYQIFLPAAGSRFFTAGYLHDGGGNYWSNWSSPISFATWRLVFWQGVSTIGIGSNRAQGYSVRCVAR